MDSRMTPSGFTATLGARWFGTTGDNAHIVDQMIAERSTKLSRHPMWPLLRPFLLRFLHYRQAVDMADTVADMSGWDAMSYLSDLLSLDVTVDGLENLPRNEGFILAPTHPTGIPDGVAIFDVLKNVRPDMAIFANRDALRVANGLRDLIIPVEWRQGEKSHAKSRDTLEMTARAFAANKAVVLFPSGRIAYWNEDVLTERPWQTSIVSLARRYRYPVVPARITARNSGLFYLLSKYSTELRDMTIFHELLNKKGRAFSVTIGKPIALEALDGEPAELAAQLQQHTVHAIAADRDAEFCSAPAAPGSRSS
ncbi:acyltransferase [Mesorhizobium sp. NBSH29]|uniref:1-acyl-sn-glycerol-3-phosphate acyltransferase n=1 Tax=Mesorhizobium sp. NBSH29 TaxID=2654249 RepID=UPI0018968112|nr:1-acyl-sn-glycerol-3-phosphate acyltransferase [Mesorhizobium sp. NBSH29]QPC85849.1 acyltransferase [Mesorhizobium sp. NBSH29]